MTERGRIPRRSTLVGLVLGLPLSALFLWLAFRDADVAEVWSVVTRANVGLLALALAALAVVYVGQAVRWHAIARTPQVSTARFGEMVVSSIALNNVLPGRVGDLLRARWLQVAARIPGGRALATVFVDRAFDVFALVVFLAVSLPFVSSAEWLRRIAIGGLVFLVGVGLVLLAARAYTRHRTRERRGHRGLLRRIARDTVEALADPLGRMRAVGLAGLSLGIWTMWALAASFVARAVGVELSPIEALFVTAVINLGVAIPSSPGFVGTYQWLGIPHLRSSTSEPRKRSPSRSSCTLSGTCPRHCSAAGCSCAECFRRSATPPSEPAPTFGADLHQTAAHEGP